MNTKQRVWELVDEAKPGDRWGRAVAFFIITLIFVNVTVAVIGTMKSVHEQYGLLFETFEIFSVIVFTLEYLARVWSCVSLPQYAHPIRGRLKFILRPMAIIDLLAIVPFFLSFIEIDLLFIRAFRLFRIFRIAKLGRYASAIKLFLRVLRNKKEELLLTLMVLCLFVVVAAPLMYYAENEAQPDKFPDIPMTMWWTIMTLTTVDTGVQATTSFGKFLTVGIALWGIGMFALPAGILSGGFIEEVQKHKAKKSLCPHCNKELA